MAGEPGGPFSRHLFAAGKSAYVRGERARPDVECILCEVVARRDTVERLEVGRDRGFVVSLNLFPYNPGHLLLFPERHVEDPRALTPGEVRDRHLMLARCLDLLEDAYGPAGFNVGSNVGRASGRSIPHWHEHVVPRYPDELGFLDLVGGARLMVETPEESLPRLREAFARTEGDGA